MDPMGYLSCAFEFETLGSDFRNKFLVSRKSFSPNSVVTLGVLTVIVKSRGG